jgi:hypothetical protein
MASLTTTLQELMTPSLLGRLASDTGLPESKVKVGVTGAVAVLFEGLAGKANDTEAMSRVARLISRGPDVDVDRPERLLEEDSPARKTGKDLLGIAIADSSGLISRLASMLGIGGKSAGNLVAGAGSLLFAGFRTVGKSRGGLDANTLASILHDERRAIHVAMPRELAQVVTKGASGDDTYVDRATTQREHPRTRWWLWLVALALIASSRGRLPSFRVKPVRLRVLGWSSIG